MTHCKQILMGMLMILIFPLALVLGLIAVCIFAVGTTIGGFFCGPYIIAQEMIKLQICITCILSPLYMVVGAVAGLFGGIGFGMYFLALKAFHYGKIVIRALCFEPSEMGNGLYDESEP
jgi:hypothetical protein